MIPLNRLDTGFNICDIVKSSHLSVDIRWLKRSHGQIWKAEACVCKRLVIDDMPVKDVEFGVRHGIQIPQNHFLVERGKGKYFFCKENLKNYQSTHIGSLGLQGLTPLAHSSNHLPYSRNGGRYRARCPDKKTSESR